MGALRSEFEARASDRQIVTLPRWLIRRSQRTMEMLVPSLANDFCINAIQQSFTNERVLIRSHFIVHCSVFLIQDKTWHECGLGEVKNNFSWIFMWLEKIKVHAKYIHLSISILWTLFIQMIKISVYFSPYLSKT